MNGFKDSHIRTHLSALKKGGGWGGAVRYHSLSLRLSPPLSFTPFFCLPVFTRTSLGFHHACFGHYITIMELLVQEKQEMEEKGRVEKTTDEM